MSDVANKKVRLVESVNLAPDVHHYVFEVPGPDPMVFEPGQYVFLHQEVDGRRVSRPYSIASAPNTRNQFELCLNRLPGGPIQPGDELGFDGPKGSFRIRKPSRDSLFVANGTGIAPLRSMIHHLLQTGASPRIQLLLGSRSEGCILYRDEFESLAEQHPNFMFHPTLSNPSANWTGLRGRVQEHVPLILDGRTDVDVYLCGLRDMVNDLRERLTAAGFDPESVLYEKYN